MWRSPNCSGVMYDPRLYSPSRQLPRRTASCSRYQIALPIRRSSTGRDAAKTAAPSIESTPMPRNFDYQTMSPEQFREALRHLGLNRWQFAWMFGTNPDRVSRWLKGTEDIPHIVAVAAGMATVPEARQIATTYTEGVAVDRRKLVT